jgi:deoxycytidine triphosphate deaminase
MPHLPIPPKSFQSKGLTQLTGTIAANANGVVNIAQPNSNIAQQIKDVAEQQARMVINEWMKQNKDLFDSKETKLKIQNVQNIVGQKYDDRLTITGVVEEDKYYEFHLNNDRMNEAYTILLHRRQTDSGHYIMQYDSKTLWVTKEEIDMPEKIIICMQTI